MVAIRTILFATLFVLLECVSEVVRVRDDAADRGAARCDGSKVNICTRKIRVYLNNIY